MENKTETVLTKKLFGGIFYNMLIKIWQITVKFRLSERRLSETSGLLEDDGQSRLFSYIIYCNKTTDYSNFRLSEKFNFSK